jgi:hypothetical protein
MSARYSTEEEYGDQKKAEINKDGEYQEESDDGSED